MPRLPSGQSPYDLSDIMRANGWSYATMSEALGGIVNASTLMRIATARTVPTPATREAIARRLGLSPSQIAWPQRH
jgi:lambda repressor-like predicted transcriptional regulator